MYEAYEADVETGGTGRQVGRLVATLIGVAALVVGAFLNWTPARTGDKLTVRALVQTDFGAHSDIVKTVGGISILIALVALIGLVDRTGWLTRLTGAAALVVFVMFAIEAYRFYGDNLGTAVRDVRAGLWLQLAGGLLLLIGGFFGSRTVVGVPARLEERDAALERAATERAAADRVAAQRYTADQEAAREQAAQDEALGHGRHARNG
jgi:hypothetical protein